MKPRSSELEYGGIVQKMEKHDGAFKEKDNWNIVNSYRGRESFLTFAKPDRTCTIRIAERWYGSTHVEIRIGPLMEKKM